jgi:hypothetical protein
MQIVGQPITGEGNSDRSHEFRQTHVKRHNRDFGAYREAGGYTYSVEQA